MPEYLVRVRTDVILPNLDSLEDVVYDYVIEHGGSLDTVDDGGGVTDVVAAYN